MIKVSLARMAAEEIWFGQSGTGPTSNLMNATYWATDMTGAAGPSGNGGPERATPSPAEFRLLPPLL